MHTYQIRVSDEIITKFLWLLEYFKKDIEIVKIESSDDFMKSMEQSKKDIKEGKVTVFNFDDFEKKLA
jgi:phospholipid N-methyltransferase